jgi:hypothetical protein
MRHHGDRVHALRQTAALVWRGPGRDPRRGGVAPIDQKQPSIGQSDRLVETVRPLCIVD